MVRFRRLAATAALTLVTHMASEHWPATRESVVDFWRPYQPGYGQRIVADLDGANAAVAAARARGDRRVQRAVAAEWQGRVQALLELTPAAAPQLNRVLRRLPGGRVVSRRSLAARLVSPGIVLAVLATPVLLGYVHVSVGSRVASAAAGRLHAAAPSQRRHHALQPRTRGPQASASTALSTSATAAPGCAPSISSVSYFAPQQTQAVTIQGTCLGAAQTISGTNAYLSITDTAAARQWDACYTGNPGGNDGLGCNITSWTDTSITFSGFTGPYGFTNLVLALHDPLTIRVWNPQSGQGPASCQVVAGKPGATSCHA
jgi:hypothetical protein